MTTNTIPESLRPLVAKIDPARLYSIREGAEITNTKEKFLARRIERGEDPKAIRLGRLRRIPGCNLIAFVIDGARAA